ncbi:ATP-binding protein, partial [Candidatus Woesebacteria bacterium]|nr:ATP-binding protein [Candidatus Woesebacteria bacterium]
QTIVFIVLGIIAIFVFLFIKNSRVSKELKSTTIDDGVLLSIEVPRFNDKGALAAEQMFASLHGLLKYTPGIQEHISFEITSSVKGIKFYVYLPSYFHKFVESQIYAQYPSAEIHVVEDYTEMEASPYHFTGTEVVVSREYFFPIKTFRDFEVDPLAAITGALEKLEDLNGHVWFQIMVRPVPDEWQQAGYDYISAVRDGTYGKKKSGFEWFTTFFIDEATYFIEGVLNHIVNPSKSVSPTERMGAGDGPVRLSAGQEIALKAIENKLSKLGFETSMRILTFAADEEQAQRQLSSAVASLKQFSTANLNSFERSSHVLANQEILRRYRKRYFPDGENEYFVLNIEELASIFHLPSESVETPNIAWVDAKRGEPPLNLPVDDCAYIGKTIFRDRETLFGIKAADRRQHMYIIGKTGTGKSTLMKNMVIKDMEAGHGVGVLDPHGDLIEQILHVIPEERLEDVVYFNPDDIEYPMGINLLELSDGLSEEDATREKEYIAESIISLFHKIYTEKYSGPRMEYILRNTIHTAFTVPGATLFTVYKLLINTKFRKSVVKNITDENLKDFWKYEFAKAGDYQKVKMISPITNKIGRFLFSPTAKRILEQEKSTINFEEIMNEGKILLCNLSKGKLGEDNSKVFGVVVMAKLQLASLRRARMAEKDRKDFYLYVDEFQNFATPAFAQILSEARKYRLGAILAHQTTSQLEDKSLVNVTLANTGTVICFRTANPEDETLILPQFRPCVEQGDIAGLPSYRFFMRLGALNPEEPFSGITMPVDFKQNKELVQKVIESSRKKYAVKYEPIKQKNYQPKFKRISKSKKNINYSVLP